MQVSTMAKRLVGSEIIRIAGEVNEMIRSGASICNLTIGDFNPAEYPIPAELRAGIAKAYDQGHTNYPPADGVPQLREAVIKFIQKRLGLKYDANELLVAGGSRPLIYTVFLALVDPGEKVVFPVPSWNNNHYCNLVGAEACMVETKSNNNFMPSVKEIEPHLQGAVLLSLCSPLNPTGTVFSKKDLKDICDLVIAENKRRGKGEKPLYLMYDHIYWMLTFGEVQHYDPVSLCPEIRDYVLYIDGISKSFAATGVRVGYAYGPELVIAKMKSILGHIGAWAPKAEQVATAAFLNNGAAVDAYMRDLKVKIKKSMDLLHDSLEQLGKEGFEVSVIAPQGAIYLTAKFNLIGRKTPEQDILITARDINSYLIKNAGLAMVPFSAFGAADNKPWFRLSVGGCSYVEIEAMIPRLRKALAALS